MVALLLGFFSCNLLFGLLRENSGYKLFCGPLSIVYVDECMIIGPSIFLIA